MRVKVYATRADGSVYRVGPWHGWLAHLNQPPAAVPRADEPKGPTL